MSRNAFSLIERPLVIALIAMLAALFLPAMRLVRGSAHATACMNNLRQLGTAALAYAGDLRSILPAGAAGGTPSSPACTARRAPSPTTSAAPGSGTARTCGTSPRP